MIYMHVLPTVGVILGMFFMTIGFGIDIGERNGCEYTYVGLVTAPGFFCLVLGILVYAKKMRELMNLDIIMEAFK